MHMFRFGSCRGKHRLSRSGVAFRDRLCWSHLATAAFPGALQAQVLGINHQGANVTEKLRDVPLRLGDLLLLQGPVKISRACTRAA